MEQLTLFSPPVQAPTLRPYQSEIVRLLHEAIRAKPNCRVIAQMPTGTGKTVVFAQFLREFGQPALVLAHREELLEQAKNKLVAAGLPEDSLDIVLQSQPRATAQTWIASVQTLVRGGRVHKIQPRVIIIDECHHSCADSYKHILDAYPGVPVIGFTATPTRRTGKEKKALANLWDSIVYQMNLKQAVLAGWLANLVYYQLRTNISLDACRTTAGDFNEGDLALTVNENSRNEATVNKYKELGGGKAVVFAVNVAHAKNLQATFYKAGIAALFVCGETASDERHNTLAQFQASPMTSNLVICNCGILTEGWDCPDVRMIILARPTKSPVLYMQMLGRGTRKAPGKDDVIILDIVDNCKDEALCGCLKTVFNLRKGIVIEGDIIKKLTQPKEDEPAETTESKVEAAVAQKNLEIQLANILFDMPEELERSELAWLAPVEKQYICYLNETTLLKIVDDDLKYTLYSCVKDQLPQVLYQSTELKELLREATDHAHENPNTIYMWSRQRVGYLGRHPATTKQIECIKKWFPQMDTSKMSRDMASKIIGAHLAKRQAVQAEAPTAKQLWFLRSQGVTEMPATKGAASRMITELKKHEQPTISQTATS